MRGCALVGVAVADSERRVQFIDQKKGGLGGLVLPGTRNAPEALRKINRTGRLLRRFDALAVPFSKILRDMDAPRVIDYLSLDVEGAEDYVMASFPFETHTVSLVTVEAPSAKLQHVLRAHGYALLCTQHVDELWVHHTKLAHLDAPRGAIAHCSALLSPQAQRPHASECSPRCERLTNLSWECKFGGMHEASARCSSAEHL